MKVVTFQRILLLFLVLALLGGGMGAWRHSVVTKRSQWSTRTLAKAIEERDFVTAKSTLTAIPDPVLREQRKKEIRLAELQDAVARRDGFQVRQLTSTDGVAGFPQRILEEADMILAREALWKQDWDGCASLMEKWRGTSSFPGRWLLLDADRILAQGNTQQAVDGLTAASLVGEEDAQRHARLALIEAKQPWEAMKRIEAGLRTNPRSAELLSFRAQIQEAAGRTADARLDYVAAVLSAPDSPLHRDILAQFQLRMGEPSHAAETWRDAAEVTTLGIFAFKAWFWSRVSGIPLSQPLPAITEEGWCDVMKEIRSLPHGAWMSPALDLTISGNRVLSRRSEVIWLQVMENLRAGDWKTAMARIESALPDSPDTIAPELATRLLANLAALSGAEPRISIAGRDVPAPSPSAHPFLREFDDWLHSRFTGDNRWDHWLTHPASPIATLFAHGWNGAALDVGGGVGLKPVTDAPDWFDYGYARCLLLREGPAAARQWIESLPEPSAAVRLTHAEILLTSGEIEQGRQALIGLAAGESPHAGRAAWSLALAELDLGHTEEAGRRVAANPELLASVGGKEIMARIALADGRPEDALRLYQELGEQSADAMIYLSKHAFSEKNWSEARRWTGELARRFPAEPQFRQNLLLIDEQEEPRP